MSLHGPVLRLSQVDAAEPGPLRCWGAPRAGAGRPAADRHGRVSGEPMSRLVIALGSLPLLSVEIEKPHTRLGRARENDVVLPLPEVAPFHAEIVAREEGFEARALEGEVLLVNGRQVERAPLADGDLLALGGYQLRWRSAEREAAGGVRAGGGARATRPITDRTDGAPSRPSWALVAAGPGRGPQDRAGRPGHHRGTFTGLRSGAVRRGRLLAPPLPGAGGRRAARAGPGQPERDLRGRAEDRGGDRRSRNRAGDRAHPAGRRRPRRERPARRPVGSGRAGGRQRADATGLRAPPRGQRQPRPGAAAR